MRDVRAIGDAVIASVRSAIAIAVAGFSARLDALTARLDALPAGPRGEKGDAGESIRGEKGDAGERGEQGSQGEPGESIRGEKGDAGESIRGEKGDAGERGDPGKDADPEAVRVSIVAEVDRAVAALPAAAKGDKGDPGESIVGPQGEPGESIRGEKGEPGVAAYELAVERGYAGTELQWLESLRGPAGQDGKSVAGQPGAAGERGPVGESIRGEPGPPGPSGKDGESVHQDTLFRMVAAAVAQIPQAADGRDGRDAAMIEPLPSIDEARSYPRGTWAKHLRGLWLARAPTDGMTGWDCIMAGVAAVEVRCDAEREFAVKATLSDGTVSAEVFSMPVVLDRGVWREGEYQKGDHVSWDGSGWIAQRKTTDKPGTSDAFRLSTKRGRDGKDADREPPKSSSQVRLK